MKKKVVLSKNMKIRSLDEFKYYYNIFFEERRYYELELSKRLAEAENKKLFEPGHCEVCGQQTKFELDFMFSNGEVPNYRERMVCSGCQLNNRQRKIVSVVKSLYEKRCKIYMYEQITEVFKAIKVFAGRDLTGSEYIADNLLSGTRVHGILHENAECLSFKDESFDIIVSCDVFEHVNDYKSCFMEASRVLRTGGILLMTVPFAPLQQQNIQRAGIPKDGGGGCLLS